MELSSRGIALATAALQVAAANRAARAEPLAPARSAKTRPQLRRSSARRGRPTTKA
ncbi:hypothetical protein [Sediminicoccus sp. BL-A-41-H5]|uniref:hypothetical protein n=1 Tax=Sediminicoccus sp. BL-A-41-H5 TaxID=3421106 RepID=UPI003D672934